MHPTSLPSLGNDHNGKPQGTAGRPRTEHLRGAGCSLPLLTGLPSFALRATTCPDFYCDGFLFFFTVAISTRTLSSRGLLCPLRSFRSVPLALYLLLSLAILLVAVTRCCAWTQFSRSLPGRGGRTFGLFPAQGAGRCCHTPSCAGAGRRACLWHFPTPSTANRVCETSPSGVRATVSKTVAST